MLVLGIDTATDTLALSLADGGISLGTLTLGGAKDRRPREHAESLLPAIDSLCKLAGFSPSDLDGIAVVKGPGGFTGIRTGLTVAKTVAQALDIPLVGIPSLEAFVHAYPGIGLISPLLDARREEVFAALFRKTPSGIETLVESAHFSLDQWKEALSGYGEEILFIGEGAVRYGNKLAAPGRVPLGFTGSNLAILGEEKLVAGLRDDPLSLAPDYQRLPSMVVAWKKKQDEQENKDKKDEKISP
ncbi:MAG TPA: tRNA (adenosine(37)-N6)-threonylcarbamoyltransferase complex dimerization subunit type 1 TsaB [Cyanobacteria bacterium UBA8530]|nr:tRNA (adenosine(37)-N6)-threonylcarbamoyltransferase complex dimerization subunit type 1 TsaB [Cyanobacteria bacterium UBA8530]